MTFNCVNPVVSIDKAVAKDSEWCLDLCDIGGRTVVRDPFQSISCCAKVAEIGAFGKDSDLAVHSTAVTIGCPNWGICGAAVPAGIEAFGKDPQLRVVEIGALDSNSQLTVSSAAATIRDTRLAICGGAETVKIGARDSAAATIWDPLRGMCGAAEATKIGALDKNSQLTVSGAAATIWDTQLAICGGAETVKIGARDSAAATIWEPLRDMCGAAEATKIGALDKNSQLTVSSAAATIWDTRLAICGGAETVKIGARDSAAATIWDPLRGMCGAAEATKIGALDKNSQLTVHSAVTMIFESDPRILGDARTAVFAIGPLSGFVQEPTTISTGETNHPLLTSGTSRTVGVQRSKLVVRCQVCKGDMDVEFTLGGTLEVFPTCGCSALGRDILREVRRADNHVPAPKAKFGVLRGGRSINEPRGNSLVTLRLIKSEIT